MVIVSFNYLSDIFLQIYFTVALYWYELFNFFMKKGGKSGYQKGPYEKIMSMSFNEKCKKQ